jgi:hypothetical protein
VRTVVAKVSNNTQLGTVNLATSKNRVIKSNTRKYISTSPDDRLVHVLIDRKRHDVRSFRGCDCDTDHYLLLHIRERLSVCKRAWPKFDRGLFQFKKLNDMKDKEQHQIKFSNWSTGAYDVDINRAWGNLTEYTKICNRLFSLSRTNSCTVWAITSMQELLYRL